jgi:hypothetical protein
MVFAVIAAVCAGFGVLQLKNVRCLFFHGSYTARIAANDNVFNFLGQFHILFRGYNPVFYY